MGEARHREDLSTEQGDIAYYADRVITNCTGTVKTVYVNSADTIDIKTTSRSMDDFVTPHFRRRMLKGEIINNPMHSVQVVDELHPYTQSFTFSHLYAITCGGTPTYLPCVHKNVGNRQIIDVPYIGPAYLPAYVAPDYSSELDIAVTSAFAEVDVSEAMALVGLAEAEKTVQSMISLFRRAVRILTAIKDLRIDIVVREFTPKQLADRYMELRYSLRPLYYDLHNYLAALYTPKYVGQRFTGRGFQRVVDSDYQDASWSTTGSCSGSSYTFTRYYRTSWETEIRIRAGVLAQIENYNPFYSFGFDDLFESIWELVPLSFVVDWFFDVSKKIAAWTPNFGVKNLASWVHVKRIVTQASSITGCSHVITGMDNGSSSSCSGSYIRTTTFTDRTPNPSFRIMPNWKLRLNSLKLVDLAIILKQLIA